MTLEELERNVAALTPEQLAQFRTWFLEFDAENWDRQLESDVAANKLDELANEALREHRSGGSTTL